MFIGQVGDPKNITVYGNLSVVGTSNIGAVSQVGAANLDAVSAISYAILGYNLFNDGTWSPAFIPAAGVTFSGITSFGSFSQAGKVMTVTINLSATYTGVSGDLIAVSLPGSTPSRFSYPRVSARSSGLTFPLQTALGRIDPGAGNIIVFFNNNYGISGDFISVDSTFSYLL